MKNLTKQHLCYTFLNLCETHELSKITVSLLAQTAGTSRQTFYNFFQDINDLISFIPIHYLLEGCQPIFLRENTQHAYEFARKHKGFFRQLPQHTGQNNFHDTFLTWAKSMYHDMFLTEDLTPKELEHRRISVDLYCIGVTGLFLAWCADDLSWDMDILLDIQEDAVPDFMKESLRNS